MAAKMDMFQFLIGTIKTSWYQERRAGFLQVSIPYRYDKNDLVKVPSLKEKWKFQFLIGTIKTRSCQALWHINILFQFLIGTIKTQVAKKLGFTEEGFNSL